MFAVLFDPCQKPSQPLIKDLCHDLSLILKSSRTRPGEGSMYLKGCRLSCSQVLSTVSFQVSRVHLL